MLPKQAVVIITRALQSEINAAIAVAAVNVAGEGSGVIAIAPARAWIVQGARVAIRVHEWGAVGVVQIVHASVGPGVVSVPNDASDAAEIGVAAADAFSVVAGATS